MHTCEANPSTAEKVGDVVPFNITPPALITLAVSTVTSCIIVSFNITPFIALAVSAVRPCTPHSGSTGSHTLRRTHNPAMQSSASSLHTSSAMRPPPVYCTHAPFLVEPQNYDAMHMFEANPSTAEKVGDVVPFSTTPHALIALAVPAGMPCTPPSGSSSPLPFIHPNDSTLRPVATHTFPSSLAKACQTPYPSTLRKRSLPRRSGEAQPSATS